MSALVRLAATFTLSLVGAALTAEAEIDSWYVFDRLAAVSQDTLRVLYRQEHLLLHDVHGLVLYSKSHYDALLCCVRLLRYRQHLSFDHPLTLTTTTPLVCSEGDSLGEKYVQTVLYSTCTEC